MFGFNGFGQSKSDSIALHFNFKLGNEKLVLNKPYISSNKDTLQISALKFYISSIQIDYDDKTDFKQPNSYHLVDIENETSSLISITKKNNKTISRIKFAIGVDSLMSVSGALAGDLDPTNGMYWAWQSGYINFKIEGNSSSCKTRKNQFFFHVGGYKKPNYSLKMITLDVLIPKSTIDITINLKDFFFTEAKNPQL